MLYMHIYTQALGMCYKASESSHRGDYFGYRHVFAHAMDMPSVMPMQSRCVRTRVAAVPLKSTALSGAEVP